MTLIYERAFGGWDKADNDEANWRYEPRNPVGVGFVDSTLRSVLPLLEWLPSACIVAGVGHKGALS